MKFERNPEFLKQRAQAMKERRDNPSGGKDFLFKKKYEQYKQHDGENIVRLLPAMWKGAMFPWLEAFIHYQIGPSNSMFFCLAKMNNQPCPICDEIVKMKEQGISKDITGSIAASHRAIAWMIDRKEESKGPQLWTMPYPKIAQVIITVSFSRKTGEPVMVDDPVDGWDILYTKTGSSKNTQYTAVRKDEEKSPLHTDEAVADKWLEFAKAESIPDNINFSTYKHITDVMMGGESESTVGAPITSEDTKKSESKTEAKPVEQPKEEKKTLPVGEGLSKKKLKEMSRSDLVDVIETRKLDVDAAEWPEDGDLAEAVALELGL
jgi:hypothetical protein